jgi:hypothetical protein
MANNTTLEMGFEEKEGTQDIEKRTYTTDLIGFICVAHTSHLADTGKSQRISSYSRVRVILEKIIEFMNDIPNSHEEVKD